MQAQAKVSIVEKQETPTEKVLAKAKQSLMEFTDSQGRFIKLKEPEVLDMYDFFKALGKDSEISGCANMAMALLHLESIDGVKFIKPNSNAEIRAGLQRLGNCVWEIIAKIQEISSSNKEKTDEVKEELKK